MESKPTSIHFFLCGAEGFRSSWLQTLAANLSIITHALGLLTYKCYLLYNISWIYVNESQVVFMLIVSFLIHCQTEHAVETNSNYVRFERCIFDSNVATGYAAAIAIGNPEIFRYRSEDKPVEIASWYEDAQITVINVQVCIIIRHTHTHTYTHTHTHTHTHFIITWKYRWAFKILYSGKFSNGANFRIFRTHTNCAEIRTYENFCPRLPNSFFIFLFLFYLLQYGG